MMKKIEILLIVLIVINIEFLSGCTSTNKSIKGSWKDTNDDIWEFGNNTVYISVGDGDNYSYKIEGNKLFIERWLGEDGYYIMNWINDKKLELSFQDEHGYKLTEILFKQ